MSNVVTFRLSPEEHSLAVDAASLNRQTFSAFVRQALMFAVSQCQQSVASGSGVIQGRVDKRVTSRHEGHPEGLQPRRDQGPRRR